MYFNFNIEYPYKETNPFILKSQNLKNKLKKFSKENIIIISDFDFTMTRRYYINPKNNKKNIYYQVLASMIYVQIYLKNLEKK